MTRTPRELIELYWTEVWNNRNTELMRELCADPIIRHDPNSVTALSIEDQMARVRQQSEHAQPYFEHEVLVADEHHVTSVWNMRTRKGPEVHLCGIEVFRAENGRFTHCWNSSYVAGRWGREGDPSVPDHLPPPALISDLDQITPTWVQAVLQQAGLQAPRVSIVGSTPIGHGNLAVTARTAITYNANAADAVTSLICKITAQIPQALDIAQAQDAYRREAEVYRFLGAEPGLRTPRCFWSQVSADGRGLNLVLEDLSQRTRPGDQLAGCTAAEAQAVVDELTRLHKTHWNSPALDQADWLLNRAASAAGAGEVYRMGAAVCRERFTGRLSPAQLAVIDSFADKVSAVTAATPTGPTGPTLIHGEPRVDNILFEDTVQGPAAWLIDWQFSDRGSPMFDTAYFLAGSIDPALRKACERDLIARQQAVLAAVDPAFTLDRAHAEYRACLPFALFTTVGAALALPPGDHTDRLLLTLLERNIAALTDWDCA